MKRRTMIAVSVAAAVLVWIGVSAQQQEMLPRPGPGSGIIDVRGTVSIANVPEVHVTSIPSVTVTSIPPVHVTSIPPVTVSGPTFIQKGRRYTVTWPSGEDESVTVVEPGQGGGWVRVATTSGSRWINLDGALAIETR